MPWPLELPLNLESLDDSQEPAYGGAQDELVLTAGLVISESSQAESRREMCVPEVPGTAGSCCRGLSSWSHLRPFSVSPSLTCDV